MYEFQLKTKMIRKKLIKKEMENVTLIWFLQSQLTNFQYEQ